MIADLVDHTPGDRDRYVDFLRAASITAVMAGHWLVSVIERDGSVVTGTNALTSVGWLRGATWVMQVMPIFFFVGGFSNLRAIEHGRVAGGTWRSYLQRRLERLLAPTLVFVVVWLGIAVLLQVTDVDLRTAHLAARIASQPLWFLAVYLMVVALAPTMAALHRRAPVATGAALIGAMVLLDVVRFGLDRPGPAMANYVVVFLFAQQLGFAYGDGTLTQLPVRRLLGASAAAFAALVVLTTVGPYPVSMVGVPGEAVSNMSPPTVCIATLTVAQVGVLLALRPRANAWLAHRRPWMVTVAVNARIMTLFLWHLTALAVAAVVLLELGLSTPAPGSWAWWSLRPVWLLTAGFVLAVFVAVFGRAETPRITDRVRPASPTWPAVLGVIAVIIGFIGLALSGFDRILLAHMQPFLGVRTSPLVAVGLIVVGRAAVLGRSRSPG